ncbi:MAG: hypothetical protein D4R40_00180 [Nitrosomonadaceae bacterium]|nr:MAG: hypothetical protein D4R40_00180 [Nitrosomonadaceae bacterium]
MFIEVRVLFIYASMMPNLFGTNIFDIMVQMQIAAFGALLFSANPDVALGDCKRAIKGDRSCPQ